MDSTLTVIPAYGKDYKSKKEVEEAFESGADFKIMNPGYGGRYINKQDALQFGANELKIRYANKSRVHIIQPQV